MNTLFIPIHMLLEALFPLLPTPQAQAQWAVSSVLVILAVLALRLALKGRLSCRARYALWGVVLVRLLIPAQLPFDLPLSPARAVPSTPTAWEESTVPVFPSIPQDFAGTDPYYQTFEPGQLGPTEGSMGYVQRSEDGETVTTYLDLYTPAQMVQILWLVGAAAVLAVFLWSNWRFHRRLCKCRTLLTDADSPIPVYVAEGLPSPCLFGLFRPAIYLTPQELEEPVRSHVLAHELTHYAHKDHIWSVLRIFALALHWYDPLVWLAVAKSKEDGELACDEGAVRRLGEDQRLAYGRTLVDMVAQGGARPLDLLSASTTMTQGRKPLQQRVAQLVKRPQTGRVAALCAAAVVVLAGVLAFSGGRNTPYYDTLAAQVEGARAIRFSPPTYSSQFYPDPIMDGELLAQAKELLSRGQAVEEERPGVEHAMLEPSIQLTTEEGTFCYQLYQEGELTYAVTAVTGHVAAVYDFPLAHRLEQLAGEQSAISVPTLLSQEELDRYNSWFNGAEGLARQCLTSHYDYPEDIDLYQLFYLGGSIPEEVTPAERRAVIDITHGGVDPDCGCTKISRTQMDADLTAYLGLTLEETARVGLDQFTYLEEYDAYYHFHGDTNEPGTINVTHGTRYPGSMVELSYLSMSGPGVVKVWEETGRIWSNQSAVVTLAQLTAHDIQGLSGRLVAREGEYDPEEVARMLREAAAQPVDRGAVYELWSLDVSLTSGQIVRCTAGAEANLVSMEGQTFRSPELYQFIRRRWTPHPDAVVEADLTQDMENLVNSLLQAELMHWNGQTPDSPYTDVKLTAFRHLSQHPDLVKETVVRLYEFDYGFALDDLTKAGWAGGNYVDGDLLFHPHGQVTHLLTVEREGRVTQATLFGWEYLLEEGQPAWEGTVTREEIENALINELRDLLDPVVPPEITDLQAVANAYGDGLANYYLSLGLGHPKAVNGASLVKAEIYEQREDALCAAITLAVDPMSPMTAHWMSGNGLDLVEGQWQQTLDYRLQRRADGSWHCTDRGTGGVRLGE